MFGDEQEQFEPAALPAEVPAQTGGNIKIRVIEGMSSLEIEAPEAMATHLLHEWYGRQDISRDRSVNAAERILQMRSLANGAGTAGDEDTTRPNH